jgi:PAS domain S-box-containing protein
MLAQESPYIAPLVVTTAIAVAAAVYMLRRSPSRGMLPFIALMLGSAWWAGCYALELAAIDLPTKVMWTRLMYLGVVTMPPAFLFYVRRYVEKEGWLRGRGKALIAVEPILTLIMVWTNDTHHLVWDTIGIETYAGGFTALAVTHGPYFWVHVCYSFCLIGLGLVLLLRKLSHAPPLHRRQTLILLLTGVLPPLATTANLLPGRLIPMLDPTPFAALVTGLVFGYGLLRFELFDVLPVAREATMERMVEGVVVLNARGRVVDINTAARDLMGRKIGTSIGRPATEVMPFLKGVLERGAGRDQWQEAVEWEKGGTRRQLDLSVLALRDRRDRPAGHLVVLHDVTERKAAEDELRVRSTQLACLYDTALAVASQLDLRRLLPTIAERARDLLHAHAVTVYMYRPESDDLVCEAVSGTPERLGSVVARGEGLVGKVLDTGRAGKVDDYDRWPGRAARYDDLPDSSLLASPVRWVDQTIGAISARRTKHTPFTDDDLRLLDLFANQAAVALGNARLYQAAQRELQERRLAESALRASEARHRAMVEEQTEMIYRLRPDMTILYANEAACRFRGKPLQQIVGSNALEGVAPEDRARVRRLMSLVSRQQPVVSGENRLLDPDGNPRWFAWTDRGIFDEQGELLELLSVGRDVSERKRVELERERLEEQLRQAQRTESVGILAGGVAHEFNNLLTVIQGNVELMRDDLPPDHPSVGPLAAVARTTQRAATLTHQLLALSRRQVLTRTPTDVNALVNAFAPMLRHAVGQSVQVYLRLDPDLPAALADPGAVEQVLTNLALNARDAMPDGGLLVVATSAVLADEAFCVAHPTVAPGCYVRLSVTDTGSGMDEATRRHLFEPFFTTKDVGKGTGLGLSVIYGIVRQHEGTIEVQSEPGKGSTFDVYLPASGEPA